jgi:hypothetical protein
MTPSDLQRFVEEKEIEYKTSYLNVQREYYYNYAELDITLLVPLQHLKGFKDLIGEDYLNRRQVNMKLHPFYVAVSMAEVCNYYDINLKDVFEVKDFQP